jgi:hypothetical protein
MERLFLSRNVETQRPRPDFLPDDWARVDVRVPLGGGSWAVVVVERIGDTKVRERAAIPTHTRTRKRVAGTRERHR